MKEVSYAKWGLNSFSLKWIALITMAIDHMGMVLFPQYLIFRIIGRLAFPIYCFLLVEGAVHTSNPGKYMRRLLLFAVISEIPFDLAVRGEVFYLGSQNVFFTLAFGLGALLLLKSNLKVWFIFIGILCMIFGAEFLHADYGMGGVLFILVFYLTRTNFFAKIFGFSIVTILLFGGLENYAIVSLLPICTYNGKKGRGMKYFFYVFYPLHLLILYGLKKMVFS